MKNLWYEEQDGREGQEEQEERYMQACLISFEASILARQAMRRSGRSAASCAPTQPQYS